MDTNGMFICGDSREIEKHFQPESIDFVVTSPPYWAIRDYGYDNQIGFKQSYDDYLDDLKKVFAGCFKLMKDERWIAINVGTVVSKEGMKFLSGDVVRICEEIGFIFRKDIIWYKPRGQTKWQRGGTQFTTNPYPRHFNTNINHEFILLFTKGDVPRRGKDEADHLTDEKFGNYIDYERPYLRTVAYSVWEITPVNSPRLDEKHAAPFPEEIPRRLIELFSYPGENVLDPFAGAGTSLRIAKELGRIPNGVEMSKDYHNNAMKRLAETPEPKHDDILKSTATRFSRTPNERLADFDKEIDKVEKKIRDMNRSKESFPPTVASQIKRIERRMKALRRQLKELTASAVTSNQSLGQWTKEEIDSAPYESMKVADLKDALRSKGLAVSGKKAELIERLKQGD
jgi:site-specific DNA-methyltransferase (adenine-specific)